MKTKLDFTKLVNADFIEGKVTRTEKIGGSSLYTNVYTEDSCVKLGGDVMIQPGWNFKAVVVNFYDKQSVLFYQIGDNEKVFVGKKNFQNTEEFIDEYYGEFFMEKTKKSLTTFLLILLSILILIGIAAIAKKFFLGLGVGAILIIVSVIVMSFQKNYSLKKGYKDLFEKMLEWSNL